MELKTLSNGLRLALVPCEAESVAFGLFVASGSRHEPAKFSGISHLIEHMLFKGTPRRSSLEITRAIEGRGGRFNAFTGEEVTGYFTHLPSEYLEEAVDILADMYLNASIDPEEFEREKMVVIEEIKMYDDDPSSVAAENLQRALFPGSSLGVPIAGGPKTLLPMKPEDLRRYIATHYLAANTVAVLVGSFDEAAAVRIVESKLGGFRRRGSAPKAIRPPARRPVAMTKVERDIKQAQLALGYRTFGVRDPRKYAATVFDAVMGRGMSSRLFQEVREKRGLSYDISSRMQPFADAGIWTVTAGLDVGKVDKALKTIDRELKRMVDHPLSAAELKRIKEFLVGNFRLAHERVTSKLFFFGQTLLSYGRVVLPEDQVEGVRKVTAAEVQAVARQILRPSARALSLVLPQKAQA